MSTRGAIESHRQGAEVYHGAELCNKKPVELLTLLHLPKGLLPLEGVEEVGYNRATGFAWLKQTKATNHVFKTIEKTVSYAAEVTAFVEDRRMSRMTGVKSKELLVWVSISEMYIHGPESKKIVFKTPAGLSRSFPVSAFEEEEEQNEQSGDVDAAATKKTVEQEEHRAHSSELI